jgi:uncharacterized protein DUF4199
MFQKILSYGVIAGLCVGVPMFATTVVKHDAPYGMVVSYLIMLIALSAVFVAVKRHRDVDLGGVVKFWPAFAMGLGVSFIAGILYVAAWEAAQAVTHMDFASTYAKSVIEHQQAKGLSGQELARLRAEMEAFKVQYANPFYRLPMTFIEIFPIGVLVSLVSAGLLRNSRFLPAARSAGPLQGAAPTP